jgi:hypothetical protein
MAKNHVRHDAFDLVKRSPGVDAILNDVGFAKAA